MGLQLRACPVGEVAVVQGSVAAGLVVVVQVSAVARVVALEALGRCRSSQLCTDHGTSLETVRSSGVRAASS